MMSKEMTVNLVAHIDQEAVAAARDELMAEIQKFNLVGMIAEFHEKFGLEYSGAPRQLQPEVSQFRQMFHMEEAREYAGCAATGDMHGMLDALVDQVYVCLGTAYLHGFDFNEAFRRVHEANMKKVRAMHAGESKRGSSFDVVKSEGWTAPDLTDLVDVCGTCSKFADNGARCPYVGRGGIEHCDDWERA